VVVYHSTALTFVTKRNSTSPSVIQVKNRENTISIAEKLDVMNQVRKDEGIIEICCNIRFARINLYTFRNNADEITEVSKSGTKALDCVA
jgi:hypothetical protein